MKSKFTFLLLFSFVMMGSNNLFAQQQNAYDIALRYLEQNSKDLGLTETDLTNLDVSTFFVSKHNGLKHIYLQQHYQNIEVFAGITNVNILPDGKVLSMGNRLVPDLANTANTTHPGINPKEAIEVVLRELMKKDNLSIRLQEKISRNHYIFNVDDFVKGEVTVKLVFERINKKVVRLAWNVLLEESEAFNQWNARVDAVNGKLLHHFNEVIHCSFGDRGAELCNDQSHTHHHAKNRKTAAKSNKTANAPMMANTYNVFPLLVESPNHGDRELVGSPSDMVASPFGWHDTDGMPGPEYTITRGNNTHAYHDIFNLDESAGDEPDGGASLDFDFPLDLSTDLPYTQVDPVVVNLFYWNNLMHDVWYQYGFDEASGNFQVNNYGNGGQSGDHMRAEAMDGSGTNNANFSAGGIDGNAGRIQMYVWTNDDLPSVGPNLVVTAPGDLAGDYPMVPASFGGVLPDPPIVSEVVLAQDSVDNSTDICEEIANADEIAGKIAMIDRGDCQFGSKILRAENAGAIAVIICNNQGGPAGNMIAGMDGGAVTIPAVMVSRNDCNEIKMGLPGVMVKFGEKDGELEIPLPGPSGVTGDFDNIIIAHEYTHGISIRLTGGATNSDCLSSPEQAGEGWSDWFGLVMTTDKDNFAEEPRGIGTYALGEPVSGEGIRSHRYSRDMNINPHTYADIIPESPPHGVGSVWCVMIWDLYWNLVDVYGFDEDLYNGTGGNNVAMQLVLDGLKLQSCNPSFVDARDAIIDADIANFDGENVCLIWETFARRGLGVDAIAGGTESFDLPDLCTATLKINKTADISEVEAGGIITYTLEIINDEPVALNSVEVEDQLPTGATYVANSSSCQTSEANGILTIELPNLESGTSINCSYQVQVADAPFSFKVLEDGVENGTDNWTTEAAIGNDTWQVSGSGAYEGSFAWFAPNVASSSDQYLTFKESIALEETNPVLSFWHLYNTENLWDGGVVEISTNGGANWEDLGINMTQNGYNATLEENPTSPISQRPAFTGNSGQYIQTLIDLSDYSGEEVLIRFRLGCDGYEGIDGWYIDNVQLFGNLYTVTNVACLESPTTGESDCATLQTIVVGEAQVSNNDLSDALGVRIFPNPTEGKVFIEWENRTSNPAKVEVHSVNGQLMYQNQVDSGKFNNKQNLSMDLSSFPEGIYLVKIQTGEAQVTRKLVIQ